MPDYWPRQRGTPTKRAPHRRPLRVIEVTLSRGWRCRSLGLRRRRIRRRRRIVGRGLHGQPHAALLVGFEDLDAHGLSFLEVIGHLVDPLLGALPDMQQAIASRQD